MGRIKNEAIAKSERDVRRSAPVKQAAASNAPPSKYTYALASYTIEIRDKGWFIAKTVASFTGEKPTWAGPFETIETAVLAIGRRLATEIADRHTRTIEARKIRPGDPLYGLKTSTRLRAARKNSGCVD